MGVGQTSVTASMAQEAFAVVFDSSDFLYPKFALSVARTSGSVVSNDMNAQLQHCAASTTNGVGWLAVSTEPLSFFYFDEDFSTNNRAIYADFSGGTEPYFS